MTDINSSNAIAQERARIREELVRLSDQEGVLFMQLGDEVYVSREAVLRIIRNDPTRHGAA